MATYAGLSLESFGAVKYSCLGIAVFFELIILGLIYDMGKRNDFLTWICSMAVFDIATFVCFIITNYYFMITLDPQHDDDYYECKLVCRYQKLIKALGFVFLSFSVTVSSIMSYSVFHLLKYSQILNIRRSKVRFFLCLIPLVLIVAFIGACCTIPADTSGDNSFYYAWIDTLYYSPIPIVCTNFILFLFSQYRTSKIIFSDKLSATMVRPAHQTAMAVLVKRMKYFSIIQSLLYSVLLIIRDYIYDFESIIAHAVCPLCSLAVLILFLVMQPFAFDHLMYRLRLGGKPLAKSPSFSMSDTNSKAALSSVEVTSQYESSADVDLVDYDNMEDDELAKIISKPVILSDISGSTGISDLNDDM